MRRRRRIVLPCLLALTWSLPAPASSIRTPFEGLLPHAVLGTRIIGGTEATHARWPWQVAIYRATANGMAFVCGGSVIDQGWILSAAHCLSDREASHYRVLEDTDEVPFTFEEPPASGHLLSVKAIDVHPAYDDSRSEADIGLLKLSGTARSTPAILDINGDAVSGVEGGSATVTGWGFTRYVKAVRDDVTHELKFVDAQTGKEVAAADAWSPHLREANLPLVTVAACRQAYAGSDKSIDERTLCAGLPEGGRDACQGDSGGPLMSRVNGGYAQVGIVSWGAGCGLADLPGVYTRVSAYAEWLKEITGRNLALDADAGRPSADPQTPSVAPASQAPPKPVQPASENLDNKAHVSASFTDGDHVRVGQEVAIAVKTDSPGYLVLFDVLSDGSITQIYPNAASLRTSVGASAEGNHLEGGRPLLIPDRRNPYSGFRYVIDPPRGDGALVAILSDKPIRAIDVPPSPMTVASGKAAREFVDHLGLELKRDLVVRQGRETRAGWSVDIHPYTVE